jgi:hypothetical protein
MSDLVARFLTRPSGDDLSSAPDVIIGVCAKAQSLLPAGCVFEIRDILGVPTLVNLGRASLSVDLRDPNIIRNDVMWCNDLSYIMSCGGRSIWLTADEYLKGQGEP